MQSLKELYKIGVGPSSSHTMGPEKASRQFKQAYETADHFEVFLYGSLALTGKGHLTDKVILETFAPLPVDIYFDSKEKCPVHPNTMDLIAFKEGKEIGKWRVYSVGGGTIEIDGMENSAPVDIYPYTKLDVIKEYCQRKEIDYADYVCKIEGESIKHHLASVWKAMQMSIIKGLEEEGLLPGKLHIQKRAKHLFESAKDGKIENPRNGLLSAYAYAVTETNSSGGQIVTAPTCGASGVLPAVLLYAKQKYHYTEDKIIHALAVAGLFGNLVKENASISGAECGCQAEVGTACSMASAALADLQDMTLDEIEDAAEIAMENHLGLTCDPIYGYVQIPCIQRNAAAAMRAFDVVDLTKILGSKQKVSFDMVVDTMYETGKDLQDHYRETSTGGLAKKYCRNKFFNNSLEEKIEESSETVEPI